MNNKGFYMVFVEGKQPPAYKHETLASAKREARRLAKETECKVYVLGTIKSFKRVKFLEENCAVEDLPF